jgi:hypothetical protein
LLGPAREEMAAGRKTSKSKSTEEKQDLIVG